MRARVLITGAAGNIGGKLSAYFRAQGRDVSGIDVIDGKFVDLRADLSRADLDWDRLFAGQDVVVHLAANSAQSGSIEDAEQNLAIDRNVAAACAAHNIPRLVFASSQWTMQGYFDSRETCHEVLPPQPLRPYGAAKAQTEQELLSFEGTSLCLRVGHAMWDNSRWLLPPTRFDRNVWLSDRDLCAAFERAVDSSFEGYAVLNVTSANFRSRWPIGRARELIGYAPRDGTSLIDVFWGTLRGGRAAP